MTLSTRYEVEGDAYRDHAEASAGEARRGVSATAGAVRPPDVRGGRGAAQADVDTRGKRLLERGGLG